MEDDDLQELKSKSEELDSDQFRYIWIIRLPDYLKDMFQRIDKELSNDGLLWKYLLLISRDMFLSLLLWSSIILIQVTLNL